MDDDNVIELELTELELSGAIPLVPGVTVRSYDVRFFDAADPTFEHLAMARVGLDVFLAEATEALEGDHLTVDQRVHVATIVSYIEALGRRFDRISIRGFEEEKRSSP